jgi:hypothetical protein
MPMPRNLGRTAGFLGLAAALLLAAGCGRKEVSARTQGPKITQWKCRVQNDIAIPKGIVVEEQAGRIRARFCDLKPGPGFEIASTLSYGTHFADRNAIIFPLGMPESANVQEWIQAGGPHLTVSFDSHAARLIGYQTSSAGDQSFEFTRSQ